MALQVPFNINGYEFTEAYVNATVARSDKNQTAIIVNVWPTQADRTSERPPLYSTIEVVQTNMLESADNPIAYAYKLLKTLPKYSSATDV